MKCLIDVHKFRNALLYLIEFESHKILEISTTAWNGLSLFPHGACHIASNLLGVYLKELGHDVALISIKHSSVKFPCIKSHAWLEVANQYIDITASQFQSLTKARVLIQDKRKSEWLFDYAEEARSAGKYQSHEPYLDDDIADIYYLIIRKII
ncbi:hypothetical protein [Pseudaeromonas paramecii]|uniref:Uncharacterized protein n=1 Tax=Pseudaeromonas paramecii TaxID=2138166 RepID=A0ABP8QN19_9GAMM